MGRPARRPRGPDRAAGDPPGQALDVEPDQAAGRDAARDHPGRDIGPGQRPDLPDAGVERRQVAHPDRRRDRVDALAAEVRVRRIVDVAEGRADPGAEVEDRDAMAAQPAEQRRLVRRGDPGHHRHREAERGVDHARVPGGTAGLRRLLAAADGVDVARDRADHAGVERVLGQGAKRTGYFAPALSSRVASPTTPRRNSSTQTTKIAPVITVTQPPNWAR